MVLGFRWITYVLCTLLCCASTANSTQETLLSDSSQVATTASITIEQLERSLSELEQNSAITAEAKTEALENYRAAIKNLQSAADNDGRLTALIAETESVPARVVQLKAQRDEIKNKKPVIDPRLSLQQMEQLLPTFELQLSGYKKSRLEAEAELQNRSPRRKEIRARIVAVQDKISDATTQLNGLAKTEPSPQNQSLSSRLWARRIMLEKEKPALEGELAKFDAEESADLIRLRIEVATCNVAFSEKLIGLLQEQINVAREYIAEDAVKTARRAAISADPALKIYAEQNQRLAEEAKLVAESLAETNSKLKVSNDLYEVLVRQFAQTRKKVESVGRTSSIGALLRKQLTLLPDVEPRREGVQDRQQLINDTQYKIFEYEESQQELTEIDPVIERIVSNARRDAKTNKELLEPAARDLMNLKRQYLDDLVRSTGQYFDALIELDAVEQQIIAIESEYENYINQRVLWIRSGPPITAKIEIQDSEKWLLDRSKWEEAAQPITQDARRYPILYVSCFALFALLLFRGRTIRRTITTVGERAEKANCRSITPTLRVVWLTSIASLGWPLLFLFLGWRLCQSAGDSEFTNAIGQGLKLVGVISAMTGWIRQACRGKGLGESHFGWPEKAMLSIRRELKIWSILALPTVFVTTTLASSDGIHERGDLQRIAFIFGMLVLGIGTVRLLKPSSPFRESLVANKTAFSEKIWFLILCIGVSVPLALAVLTVAGYFYTARTLFWRLFATCLLVTALIVLRSILYRMLLLRRRHLSMKQARERSAAASNPDGADSQLVAGIVTDDKQTDITAHSLQSRNLVRAGLMAITLMGLWTIWVQVLPALSIIGNYPLWGKAEAVAIASVTPQPSSPAETSNASTKTPPTEIKNQDTQVSKTEASSNSVTISDLTLAILIIFIAVVLFRNGPGLLEMSILQQLPLDASVRYAITTLASYIIAMAGMIAACSTIGLQWSQIQWLATALTFGLAFGLQEMFANFVAGLIILVERPIRVGDIVTVDDVTGVVSRIRIRATSITNWDRKEYVVPNKEFITGRLLNWTLSDKVNRILIEVGLAYGSDTERARELLLQVANDHPMILKDPTAMATFEGFGDNSLNLVLRAFLPNMDNRLQVIHELHTEIDKVFRAENLEIAFPQLDLHVRSMVDAKSNGIASDENNSRNQRSEAA